MANFKKKVLKYIAFFEPQKEGGFTVTVPALPGCISEGDTFEESMANIKEAIGLYLEDDKERKFNGSPPAHSESFIVPIEVRLA